MKLQEDMNDFDRKIEAEARDITRLETANADIEPYVVSFFLSFFSFFLSCLLSSFSLCLSLPEWLYAVRVDGDDPQDLLKIKHLSRPP